MKKLLYILILVLISVYTINAQTIKDTTATIAVDSITQTSINELEFDLWVQNVSDSWQYFANGTFQLVVPSIIDYSNLSIQYIEGSGQLYDPVAGLPPYIVNAGVLSDRISIIVIGPETVDEARKINTTERKKIGRFVLRSSDTREDIGSMLNWREPVDYYQACAFKYDETDPEPNSIEYKQDDNFELSDTLSTVKYLSTSSSVPPMALTDFWVRYTGKKTVAAYWKTATEYKNRGFIIRRGLDVTNGNPDDFPDSFFTDTVADYRNPRFNLMMRGSFISLDPKDYGPIPDTVKYRNSKYCYRLFYQNYADDIIGLASTCLDVPNAVIEFAQANPNPFSDKTVIRYILKDNVRLTVTVRDLLGQEIVELTDRESGAKLKDIEMTAGEHFTVFQAPLLVAQGAYDIIFIAIPIDDNLVEESRAQVRVQLVKGQ